MNFRFSLLASLLGLCPEICHAEAVRVVFVGSFSDENVPSIVMSEPPSMEDWRYRIHFGFSQETRVCLLQGFISGIGSSVSVSAMRTEGVGVVSCNDGSSQELRWVMTLVAAAWAGLMGKWYSNFWVWA